SPQRVVARGERRCSDDWCITVDSVRRAKGSTADTVTVTFGVASRARRAAQRERFVVAYLRAGDGRRFDALADPSAVPFDTLLAPGQTMWARRRFVVPAGAAGLGLVIAREGGFQFPGCCIIGD